MNAVCLTGMLVPYYSMVSLVTANPYERGLLGNIQQIFQTLGNVVVNATFITLLSKFTSSTKTVYTQRAFTIAMLIYCLLMVVISLFCVYNTKERVKDAEISKAETVKKKNDENVMAAGFALTGLSGGNAVMMTISNVLKGCGVGMAGSMALGMVGDTITYGKLKSGIDTVGMGNAGISATQKIGLGLGQAVFGWGLTAAGMDGTPDAQGIAQPESVTAAINFMYGWLPAVMAGVMFILFLLF